MNASISYHFNPLCDGWKSPRRRKRRSKLRTHQWRALWAETVRNRRITFTENNFFPMNSATRECTREQTNGPSGASGAERANKCAVRANERTDEQMTRSRLHAISAHTGYGTRLAASREIRLQIIVFFRFFPDNSPFYPLLTTRFLFHTSVHSIVFNVVI